MIHEAEQLYDLGKLPLSRRPHVATAHRWASRGVKGVRLNTTKIGGRTYVSREQLDAFLAALNSPAGARPAPPSGAAERAGRELERLGA